MIKDNKLHEINRWNYPAFMPDKKNIFDGVTANSQQMIVPNVSYPHFQLSTWRAQKIPFSGYPEGSLSAVQGLGDNKVSINDLTTFPSNPNIYEGLTRPVTSSSGSEDSKKKGAFSEEGYGWKAVGAATAALGAAGKGEGFERGMWDRLDPMHYLAGGKNHKDSDVGNAFGDAGVSLTQAGISSGNPALMAAGAGAKIIGEGINALWGIHTDKKALERAENSINQNSNYMFNANSFDDIVPDIAGITNSNVYTGGVFKKGTARRRNQNLLDRMVSAHDWAVRSRDNGVSNIEKNALEDFERGSYAFGGPLEQQNNNMNAIGYNFMSDYLTMRNRQADQKGKMTNMFMGTPNNLFDFGGDLQTNGADFPTGLTHVNAGGSHEENPYDGVQMGVDPEGVPNMVEEGEVVYNDYVFSNRINMDSEAKKKFHLAKKKDITYAEAAKKLEKEIQERPNDPISRKGFDAQMEQLAEEQERQKQEIEARRAKEAFESLSPQEQTALMNELAMQKNAAMQQQAGVQAMSPEEQAYMEQAAMQQGMEQQMPMETPQASPEMFAPQPQIAAFGGRINRFDDGGKKLRRIMKLAGNSRTWDDFWNWAQKNKVESVLKPLYKADTGEMDWQKALKNELFLNALTKENPALRDVLSRGYDWGEYQPSDNNTATIQSIDWGNWRDPSGKGWVGSEDLAFKQATEGLTEDEIKALTSQQLAARMKATEAYKNTSKWLENQDNALLYLNTLLNDSNTPEVAKRYARKFVKNGKWTDGFTYDYGTVFGKDGKGVRETNPGTYWHSVLEANRGNVAKNMMIDADGNVREIVGDLDGLELANTYKWDDPTNSYVYNYYRTPEAKKAEEEAAEQKKEEEEESVLEPMLYDETNLHLANPFVNLALMATGLGRPDTSEIEKASRLAAKPYLAGVHLIGDYERFNPLSPWYAGNRQLATAESTNRYLTNNAAPIATKMAGVLANGLNTQNSQGALYRQGLEYNDALENRVDTFNRETNLKNMEALNRNSEFNATALNSAMSDTAKLRMQAASEKMDADTQWYNSLYGNINAGFDRIGQWEKWKRDHNMIAKMYANGLAGTVDENTPVAQGYVRRRKKGLTI